MHSKNYIYLLRAIPIKLHRVIFHPPPWTIPERNKKKILSPTTPRPLVFVHRWRRKQERKTFHDQVTLVLLVVQPFWSENRLGGKRFHGIENVLQCKYNCKNAIEREIKFDKYWHNWLPIDTRDKVNYAYLFMTTVTFPKLTLLSRDAKNKYLYHHGNAEIRNNLPAQKTSRNIWRQTSVVEWGKW